MIFTTKSDAELKKKIPTIKHLDHELIREEEDSLLIVKDHTIFRLGRDETLLWKIIDNKKTIKEIVSEYCKSILGVPKSKAECESLKFFNLIEEKRLIKLE